MDEISLSDNISLYEPTITLTAKPPPQNTTTTTPLTHPAPAPAPPPSLIILCTWLGGATPRRTARYVAGYRGLFPRATILLLRTELADMTYRTTGRLRARLAPAHAVLARHAGCGGVLLHFFSHGGLATAVQLLASLAPPARARLLCPDRGQLRLIIADCCPGNGSFGESVRAGLAATPRRRVLGGAYTAGLYGTAALVYALHGAGVIRSVPALRGELLDPAVFGAGARRLYLTSAGDTVIAAAEVAAHARLAAAAGYSTAVVRFEQALHCALVLEDPEKYWVAVRKNWEAGWRAMGERLLPPSLSRL